MLLSEIKWFMQQTARNKIEIILVAIIVLLIYTIRVQYVQNTKARDDYRRTDSIYRNRLSNTHLHYQQELQKCNDQLNEELVRQNKAWLDRYEELLEEVNKTYQKLKQ